MTGRLAPSGGCATSSNAIWPPISSSPAPPPTALALAACCPSHGAVVCHQRSAHQHRRVRRARDVHRRRQAAGRARRRRQARRRPPSPRCSTPWAAASTSSGRACCRCRRRPSSARSTPPAEVDRAGRSWPGRAACGCTWTAPASPTPWSRLGCAPAALTWQAGVDVLSFGATKNGALGVEAVIFFDRALAGDFLYRRKRAGQLVSKGRYLGRTDARLPRRRPVAGQRPPRQSDGRRPGRRAPRDPGVRLPLPVDANEVFAIVPRSMHDALQAGGARYLEWPGEVRAPTSSARARCSSAC